MVYNSNGAKSSYQVCTGEIHRRVMEILCAGSCRGNARGMRWERGGKLVSLSFSALSFFFSAFSFSHDANRTSTTLPQTRGYKGGYGLRIPSALRSPLSRGFSAFHPRIITAKKRKRALDIWNVTLASRLAKYRWRITARRACIVSLGTSGQISFYPRTTRDYESRFRKACNFAISCTSFDRCNHAIFRLVIFSFGDLSLISFCPLWHASRRLETLPGRRVRVLKQQDLVRNLRLRAEAISYE